MQLYCLLGGWAGNVVGRNEDRINKTIQMGKLILKKFLSSMDVRLSLRSFPDIRSVLSFSERLKAGIQRFV